MKAANSILRKQSGIALLTTLLLLMLLSGMLVGFMLLVTSGQRMSGMDSDYNRAFYGGEAGMEKITADLATLFGSNYAPTGKQVDNIATKTPVIPGIQYFDQSNKSTYLIGYPKDGNGNPVASYNPITSGSSPYQGMSALETPYTLMVTSRTPQGSEVKLTRTTQTVGIPLFQFGMFSQTDLSFFPGPNFDFGGRVHSNGNLFLASGGPAGAGPTDTGLIQLWLRQPVTVVGDVIRDTLSNGHPLSTSSEHPGSVEVTTGSGSFQALGFGQGSQIAGLGSGANTNWPTISASYNGNLRNGVKPLNMTIVLLGAAQPVEFIRRPVQSEDTTNPGVLGERYFSQASLRILLSDNPVDITKLPVSCMDTTVAPFDLSTLANTVANLKSAGAPAPVKSLVTAMTAAGTPVLPLPLSGATTASYNTADGYWLPNGNPIIKGFIKIEAQTAYGVPCGTWKDVTQEILSLGYAGRNLYPVFQSSDGKNVSGNWTYNNVASGAYTWLPALPGGQLTPSTCTDPHPNAVIRLERVRDNPSSAPYSQNTGAKGWLPPKSTTAQACGVDPSTIPPTALATAPTDFWPNVLFDTREGNFKDSTPAAPYSNMVTLGGTMSYIDLDMTNLARWFAGAIGATGASTKDPNIAPDDFVVYFSDRRGNYAAAGSVTGTWPPLSPSGNETGEYGFSDFINPLDAKACPNSKLDTGEDLNGQGKLYTYGQDPTYTMAAGTALAALKVGQYGTFATMNGTSNISTTYPFVVDPNCNTVAVPSAIWPGTYVIRANEARENPPMFFRRALKLVKGSLIQIAGWPTCAGAVPCGLAVATENPAYIHGDYNANSAGGGFADANVAASVTADAVNLISNDWNDINSFASPFNTGGRAATTAWYRVAVAAGKGMSFPLPGWNTTAVDGSQDFGTDGGVHNFMRFVENWGGNLNYEGSLISMSTNRQAIGLYKSAGSVYSPPTRLYQFDTNFLTPALLPPRTPMFRDINTTGFTQLLLPTQ
jgi:type IV pilus assembly PilX-like protein